MTIIRLGQLATKGDASRHLLECLSGREFPLGGIAETPYVPGREELKNFSHRLYDPKVCYLVEKRLVMQVLSSVSPQAFKEVKSKYKKLTYLPFRRRSCEIVM